MQRACPACRRALELAWSRLPERWAVRCDCGALVAIPEDKGYRMLASEQVTTSSHLAASIARHAWLPEGETAPRLSVPGADRDVLLSDLAGFGVFKGYRQLGGTDNLECVLALLRDGSTVDLKLDFQSGEQAHRCVDELAAMVEAAGSSTRRRPESPYRD